MLLSFAALVRLQHKAISFTGIDIHGRFIKNNVPSRVLLRRRNFRPILSQGWNKVRLVRFISSFNKFIFTSCLQKTCENETRACLVTSDGNSSDEQSVQAQYPEQDLSDSTKESAENNSQSEVEEDSEKHLLFDDEAVENIPPKWYLLQVTRGRERAVRETLLSKAENTKMLRGRLLSVLVPWAKKVVLSPRGIPKVRMEPVFSGYVLVKLKLTDSAYRSIKETLFVVGFVSFSNRGKRKSLPEPLRESEAEEILRKAEPEQSRSELAVSVGDKVQVETDDINAYGIVSQVGSDYAKVECLLQGSAASVEAKIETLRPVSDEEFEVAVKNYLKSRQAKLRQKPKQSQVSKKNVATVVSKDNESNNDERQKTEASEIDLFIDDLEREERERQQRKANLELDPNYEQVVPVSGTDSYLLDEQLFLGNSSE